MIRMADDVNFYNPYGQLNPALFTDFAAALPPAPGVTTMDTYMDESGAGSSWAGMNGNQPTPSPTTTTFNGSKWGDIFKGITGVFNSVFPVIYNAATGKPIVYTGTGPAPKPAATSPALTPDKIQQYLLIAGVVVLGVALALLVFRKSA